MRNVHQRRFIGSINPTEVWEAPPDSEPVGSPEDSSDPDDKMRCPSRPWAFIAQARREEILIFGIVRGPESPSKV